ncbi:hypothetical protein [Chryseobacterium sp. MP_3.2]|uniref:hypothetical protein n=1 Tax=Chryseobacterium sp. MP_3.2 TaxID=3071712 RepID=UPI002E01F644|nr:hypothetical protein [Chryseobacterium sp. MP_3.2]
MENTTDLLDYLKNNISTSENEIMLSYDDIKKMFDTPDHIVDQAIALLIKSNVLISQDRRFKREFFIF